MSKQLRAMTKPKLRSGDFSRCRKPLRRIRVDNATGNACVYDKVAILTKQHRPRPSSREFVEPVEHAMEIWRLTRMEGNGLLALADSRYSSISRLYRLDGVEKKRAALTTRNSLSAIR